MPEDIDYKTLFERLADENIKLRMQVYKYRYQRTLLESFDLAKYKAWLEKNYIFIAAIALIAMIAFQLLWFVQSFRGNDEK